MWTEALTRPADASTAPYLTQVTWPAPEPETQGTAHSRQAAVDLAGRMRAMWR